MPTLDPRFIVTSDLESLFRDKTTGEPLSGGIVEFFSDPNFSVRKSVYQLTLSPAGEFVYAPLPNPSVLSSVGTFQDALGNNIVPYYFPFQGTPDDSDGTLELYFITVKDSGGGPQFTRSYWPNEASDISPTPGDFNGSDNFIANGQFITHNNIPADTDNNFISGKIGVNSPLTQIAQGGWYFRIPGSTVTGNYIVTFPQQPPSFVSQVGDYPRYLADINVQSFGSDSYAALGVLWPNVNQFNSVPLKPVQVYTLFLNATALTGSGTVRIYYVKKFGVGGSSDREQFLGSFNIGSGFSAINITNISFGSNELDTVGPANDDSIALEFRLSGSAVDAQFTDVVLLQGTHDLTLTGFPQTTNAEMLVQSLNGYLPTPDFDGNDFYLPIVVTNTGTVVDRSSIGTIVAKLNDVPVGNELFCDGSVYPVNGHSPLGIPYSRLFYEALFRPTLDGSLFGSGPTFAVAVLSGSQISITYKDSLGTIPTEGSPATGFTFVPGGPPFLITVTGAPPQSSNFLLHTSAGAYTVWYNVDGAGVAPPGGNVVEVKISGSDTTTTIAHLTVVAINSTYFALPNLSNNPAFDNRGMFLRGTNVPPSTLPPSAGQLGSFELDMVGPHTHPTVVGGHINTHQADSTIVTSGTIGYGTNASANTSGDFAITVAVQQNSGTETRPIDMRVYWYIKY